MKARRMLVAAMALMGVVALASGCSSEQTSTTTTRTTQTADASSRPASYSAPAPSATTSTTTTTTSTESDSVLGAAFHLVGTVILLPFRIIGLIV
jgi:hypothetical protein